MTIFISPIFNVIDAAAADTLKSVLHIVLENICNIINYLIEQNILRVLRIVMLH